MRTIVLEGRCKHVVNRNTFEAVYLFHDTECGEVLLTVPKKLTDLYRSIDTTTQFKLLAKMEGYTYRRSLADPVRHRNKLIVIKKLKNN